MSSLKPLSVSVIANGIMQMPRRRVSADEMNISGTRQPAKGMPLHIVQSTASTRAIRTDCA